MRENLQAGTDYFAAAEILWRVSLLPLPDREEEIRDILLTTRMRSSKGAAGSELLNREATRQSAGTLIRVAARTIAIGQHTIRPALTPIYEELAQHRRQLSSHI